MLKKKIMFWLIVLIFLPIQVQAWSIKASWDANSESDLAGYKVYMASSYYNLNNGTYDIAEFSVNKPSFCYNGISSNIKVIFAAVTAYDIEGLESEFSNIVYSLRGNIWGTSNDGVFYTEARVDGQDLTSLGLYFGSITSHKQYNCSETFTIEDTTLDQRSDFDQSNRIDGRDLIELGIHFGNTAQ